jgi:hypothetical protein
MILLIWCNLRQAAYPPFAATIGDASAVLASAVWCVRYKVDMHNQVCRCCGCKCRCCQLTVSYWPAAARGCCGESELVLLVFYLFASIDFGLCS